MCIEPENEQPVKRLPAMVQTETTSEGRIYRLANWTHRDGIPQGLMDDTVVDLTYKNGNVERLKAKDVAWSQVESFKVPRDIPKKKSRKHNHYFKYVGHLKYIDVYRVLSLFGVTDEPVAHAIKKLLVSGNRGHKDKSKDIQEAIDSLKRFQQMVREDAKLKPKT